LTATWINLHVNSLSDHFPSQNIENDCGDLQKALLRVCLNKASICCSVCFSFLIYLFVKTAGQMQGQFVFPADLVQQCKSNHYLACVCYRQCWTSRFRTHFSAELRPIKSPCATTESGFITENLHWTLYFYFHSHQMTFTAMVWPT